LRLACIAVVIVILCLGLWPFHAPTNDVIWLPNRSGLQFGDYGTVMSAAMFQPPAPLGASACSVEIWVEAADAPGGGTILAFYVPGGAPGLLFYQSVHDLLVRSGPTRKRQFYVSGIFRPGSPLFVTMTSGSQGTAVYINGKLTATAPHFRLLASDCAGRLLLGDSPLQQNTWSGRVYGGAVYYARLDAATVLRHYDAWENTGRPRQTERDKAVAVYLFDERTGRVAHNDVRGGQSLFIPSAYTVLDQTLLEPFWEEFDMSWGYWKNVVKNIVGFVPLGFCFYGYLQSDRRTPRPALAAVLFGTAVSLTIEVLQSYLPSRQSGTTDLITNTLGTYAGICLYRVVDAVVAPRISLARRQD